MYMHALDTVVFNLSVTAKMISYDRFCIDPFHYKEVIILQPRPFTGVLNTTDERPNDIHGLPVGGHDVGNSSNS